MKDHTKMAKNVEQAVVLLKALGNKHRLMVLCALQDQELSVSQLNDLFPMPQSTLSQHLAWLRKENFVTTRREAQTIFYRLSSTEVIEVIAVLHRLYCED